MSFPMSGISGLSFDSVVCVCVCVQFEVPALLIQWECVVDSGGYLDHKVKTACQHWSEANPCGRVVLLCDGTSVAKGVSCPFLMETKGGEQIP